MGRGRHGVKDSLGPPIGESGRVKGIEKSFLFPSKVCVIYGFPFVCIMFIRRGRKENSWVCLHSLPTDRQTRSVSTTFHM